MRAVSDAVIAELKRINGESHVRLDEPMKYHTTFNVGGPADAYVIITSKECLVATCRYLQQTQLPFCVIGNGSDLLVADAGYRGVIVEAGRKYASASVVKDTEGDGAYFIADAGYPLRKASAYVAKRSLSGLEFACGIPGSLGGAVIQNAGAYGSDMAAVVSSAELMYADGSLKELSLQDLDFGYRTSYPKREHLIVVSVKLRLSKKPYQQIKALMDENTRLRRQKQPLELPSAGSMFLRPLKSDGTPYYVGPTIIEAGLQGASIGGAQVSLKHAGFIVNTGDATAQDIYDLIRHIQNVIKEKYGVTFVPELNFLGEFCKRRCARVFGIRAKHKPTRCKLFENRL